MQYYNYTDNGAVIARSGWLGFTDDHTHRGHMRTVTIKRDLELTVIWKDLYHSFVCQ